MSGNQGSDNVVTILWNGGVDQYRVDPTSVREMTPEELQKEESDNNRYFPTFESDDHITWVKGKFLDSRKNQAIVPITATQCVRCGMHVFGSE